MCTQTLALAHISHEYLQGRSVACGARIFSPSTDWRDSEGHFSSIGNIYQRCFGQSSVFKNIRLFSWGIKHSLNVTCIITKTTTINIDLYWGIPFFNFVCRALTRRWKQIKKRLILVFLIFMVLKFSRWGWMLFCSVFFYQWPCD